ncbi:MAG: hypothetical protein GC159_20150 [Phycisphaera sp.]|nr:hypothetical protein [Phycisphaera sp.]
MIDMLTGAELVGSFSVVGGEQSDKLHKESYTIVDVTKLQDNLFLFRARIRYGDRDVTMPMPLPVIWSGDTPVITLTNAPIPGLGTFSARVLFADGMYAGTWRHGEHAGHLFGEIKRAKPADAGDGAATDGAAK